MPIYEYQCKACEVVVEELQKISDAPLKKCPECGKNKLEKLVSAPSFRLSGTGWYETDFKTDNDIKRNLASDDSGKKSGSDEGGKSKDAKSKSDNKGDSKTNTKAKSESKSISKGKTKSKSK